MANSEESDLMAIGIHCSFPECKQLDFLPFKCDCCSKVFCLEHRTYAAHRCPSAGSKETTVFICPLCARAVKMQPGDDANQAFNRHCQTECDPSNYDKVHRKKKCPVAACKERLTSINSYTCKDCGATVCLKHRLPSDHKCPGRAAPAAAAAAAHSRFALPQAFRGLFSPSSGGSGGGGGGGSMGGRAPAKQAGRSGAPARPAQPARGPPAAPAARNGGGSSSSSSSSAAVAAQLQEYRAQQQQRGGGAAAAAAAAGPAAGAAAAPAVVDLTGSPPPPQPGGAELCPQCGVRFATVQQLIAHAEQAHMDGWASGGLAGQPGGQQQQWRLQQGGSSGQLERCPHCSRQFADPVALVAHVDREHAGSQSSNCVVC